MFDSQQTDVYCRNMLILVQRNDSRVKKQKNGLVCRSAPLYGLFRVIVSEALRQAVSYDGNQSTATRLFGTQQMYPNL